MNTTERNIDLLDIILNTAEFAEQCTSLEELKAFIATQHLRATDFQRYLEVA